MSHKNKLTWYVGGLHFECMQCGGCCAGPGEGYIWVSRPEIEIIADFLKMSEWELRRRFLKRYGLRTSIIEHSITRDCVFLQGADGQKRCVIYPVRPRQCRSWPFWASNLASCDTWNKAGQKCGGINRGRYYSFEEIENIKSEKKWWQQPEKQKENKSEVK